MRNTYEHRPVSDGKIQITILILRRGPCLCFICVLVTFTEVVRHLQELDRSGVKFSKYKILLFKGYYLVFFRFFNVKFGIQNSCRVKNVNYEHLQELSLLGKTHGTISAVQMDFVQIAFQPPPPPQATGPSGATFFVEN